MEKKLNREMAELERVCGERGIKIIRVLSPYKRPVLHIGSKIYIFSNAINENIETYLKHYINISASA